MRKQAVRASWGWSMVLVVFLAGLALVAYALLTGRTAIHGSPVYRSENPPLYWAQLFLLSAVTICMLIILLRGGR
jgi:hypothetical protein